MMGVSDRARAPRSGSRRCSCTTASRSRAGTWSIVGRGLTIGRPLAVLLSLKEPNTRTRRSRICHTGIELPARVHEQADILVAAAGSPSIIRPDMVKPGAAVVGAGLTMEGRRVVPDVDEACAEVAGWITPRLGGVGPTTRAMLLRNTVEAAERRGGRRRERHARHRGRAALPVWPGHAARTSTLSVLRSAAPGASARDADSGCSRSCCAGSGRWRSSSSPGLAEPTGVTQRLPCVRSGWAGDGLVREDARAPENLQMHLERTRAARRADRPPHPSSHADASRRARPRLPADFRWRARDLLIATVVAVAPRRSSPRSSASCCRACSTRRARPDDPPHRAPAPAATRRARARPVAAPRARRGRTPRRRARPARRGDAAGARRGHGGGRRSRAQAAVWCSTRSARVVDGRWAGLAADVELRELFDRESTMPPPLAGTRAWAPGAPPEEEAWRGVAVRAALGDGGARAAGRDGRGTRRHQPALPPAAARRASRLGRGARRRPRRGSRS